MSKVKAIPDGYNSLNSYLIVKDAKAATEFYVKAFGAKAGMHMAKPDGTGTMHAEIEFGNSRLMICDENIAWGMKSAATLGGSPISLFMYVEDVDSAFKKAVDAGCTVESPVVDAFWGDRYGHLKDPYGINWSLATHIKDVSPEEMAEGQKEFMAKMAENGGEC
ncbi:MAG: VOC family protein [Planctomycetota bacterium]|nr:VOC family protein [Planctomycetota bacterium]